MGPITPAVAPIAPATSHPVAYQAPAPSAAARPIIISVSLADADSSMLAALERNSRSRFCFSRTGRFWPPRMAANRPTPASAPKSTAASGTKATYPARSAGALPGGGVTGRGEGAR